MKPLVQRKTVPEMTPEEELQSKPLVQRQVEEEEMQMAPTHSGQRQADGSFEASASLEQRLTHHRGGGNRLPGEVRGFMEPRFGVDFGGVRVHTDRKAVQMNRELRSQAFTHGEDIYFGAGKYNTGSEAGKRLLAHELTHVVQQNSGAMQRKKNGNGGGIVQRDVEVDKLDPAGPNATAEMDADTYGIVDTESVEPTTLTATRRGGRWYALPTDLTGKYSKIITLAGATEVGGPGTDTTEDNYLKQAEDLDDLGAYAGTEWYMEEAVEDHESVHEGRVEPALEDTENRILGLYRLLSVPATGAVNSAGTATAAIKASPNYALVKARARQIWDARYVVRITGDHNAFTPAAEHAVADPMVESINEWAGEQEPVLPAYAP